ncbi:hypothetical protein EDD18DRAFT_1100556 [Armillaria luteobubalina]|uniref:Uncharacterized protein n=1 Tax=Armillaria luteobubalina TaxID=153913 RepID=A0AA39QFQ3_9AGAR|nr:hypothetical protein EDD18DRAFT_1100556 [Armillaria luteobubalina]
MGWAGLGRGVGVTGCVGCAGCASGLANRVAGGGVKGVAGRVGAGPGASGLPKIFPPGSGGGGIDGFAATIPAPEEGAKADTNVDGDADVVAKGDDFGIGVAGLPPNELPLPPPIVDSNGGVLHHISLLGVTVSSTDGFKGYRKELWVKQDEASALQEFRPALHRLLQQRGVVGADAAGVGISGTSGSVFVLDSAIEGDVAAMGVEGFDEEAPSSLTGVEGDGDVLTDSTDAAKPPILGLAGVGDTEGDEDKGGKADCFASSLEGEPNVGILVLDNGANADFWAPIAEGEPKLVVELAIGGLVILSEDLKMPTRMALVEAKSDGEDGSEGGLFGGDAINAGDFVSGLLGVLKGDGLEGALRLESTAGGPVAPTEDPPPPNADVLGVSWVSDSGGIFVHLLPSTMLAWSDE